jgi:hypothetical protein
MFAAPDDRGDEKRARNGTILRAISFSSAE